MSEKKLPQNYGILGKELRISPKTCVAIVADVKGGYIEFPVMVGEKSFTITMGVECWEALLQGEQIRTISLKEFKNNLITNTKIKQHGR